MLYSAILLDRSGSPICIYDKVYPYHEEFKLDPPVEVGTEVPVSIRILVV